MARFCVPKHLIGDILKDIKSKGIQTISDMTPADRVKFFSKHLGENGVNLATEFDRAIASTQLKALNTFIKRNFDVKYRAKMVKQAEKNTILRFIESKLYPSKGDKMSSIDDILAMPEAKREEFIKSHFGEKNAAIISKHLKQAEAVAKKTKEFKAEVAKTNKAIGSLKRKIDSYLGNGKKKATKSEFSMEKIVALSDKDRVAFLKKNGIENAEKINADIVNAKTAKEKKFAEEKLNSAINRKLSSQRGVVDRFLAGKKEKKPRSSKSMDEIFSMNEKERIEFLKTNKFENPVEINEQIVKAKLAKDMAEATAKELSTANKRVRMQKSVIDKFISEKKPRAARMTKSIDEIMEMTPEERAAFLKKTMPDEDIASVESRIKAAMKLPYEKSITYELSRYTNFNDVQRFLNKTIDSVSVEKGKIGVSVEEAKNIIRITSEINKAKLKHAQSGLKEDGVELGMKMQELGDYLGTVEKRSTPSSIALTIAGATRALLAGYELSAIGIQASFHLSKYLYSAQQWKILKNAIGFMVNEKAYKEYLADIITRDNATLLKKAEVRNTMRSGKLTEKEEDFMTNLFDFMRFSDIPVIGAIGKIGKGFERFHSGYLTQIRFETSDKMIKQAREFGMDMSDENLKYMGAVINDFTGASRLGRFESGELPSLLNQMTFSFRKVASDIKKVTIRPVKDTYKFFYGDEFEQMVAKESMKRLLGGFGMMATISAVVLQAKAGGADCDVELDPTSSKFGDIRVGEKTYNIGGGTDWVITLFARIVSNSGKNQYGVEQEYGTGMNQQSRAGAIAQTMRYKASPNLAAVIDFLSGANAVGKKWFAGADRETLKQAYNGDKEALELLKVGAKREAVARFTPIFWQSITPEMVAAGFDTQKQMEVIRMYGVGAVGVAVNDQYYDADWIDKDGKQMEQFRKEVGVQKSIEAGDKYNSLVKQRVKELKSDSDFIESNDEDKMKKIQSMKDKAKKDIFREYDFTYTK